MKKTFSVIIAILFSFLLTGCYNNYKRTITVCDGKLFVELYHHNFIDVGYEYLTDSTNFRIDVGKFDNEHGFYSYNCQGDSLTISEHYEEKITNVRKYSLIDLCKKKEGF